MANNVFANGREISCKKASGKSICAFPDVCFTPPQTPATPLGVPIPYPNTGIAKDTAKGSKHVKISGKEVILKNKSYFKKSYGDEAGRAPKKGIITSKNRGKVYFNSWSMNVKFEGKNVVRHLDLTTHNHASTPGNTLPWPYVDTITPPSGFENACEAEKRREETACSMLVARRKKKRGLGAILKGKTKENICNDTEDARKCREAQKCRLVPQKDGCCPGSGEQPHHIVEAHGFYIAGTRDNHKADALDAFKIIDPSGNVSNEYQPGDAPCVCAEGGRYEKEHGAFHGMVGKRECRAIRNAQRNRTNSTYAWTYGASRDAGIHAFRRLFPQSQCSQRCLQAQLDAYHSTIGATEATPVRTETPPMQEWQREPDHAILNHIRGTRRGNRVRFSTGEN